MGLGQAIKQDFKLIKNDPDAEQVDFGLPIINDDCCFSLPVFAQIDGVDDFKNDRKGFVFFFDNGFTGAVIILQKFVDGEWEDMVVLDNTNTYGTFYDYGFVVNSDDVSLMGYLLEWKYVLDQFGEGSYRVRVLADTVFGGEVERFTYEFCLRTYNPYLADGTVRIDYWMAGIMGDLDNDRQTKDFDTATWFDQIRLPESFFGNDTATYVRNYTRYRNGKQVWTEDNQVPEFTLQAGRLPAFLHNILKSDVLQADEISITDYNSINPNEHKNRFVIPNSSYEPRWNKGTMLAGVELKFNSAYQNLRHKRC